MTLHIAINALNISGGGGLAVLTGYLNAWRTATLPPKLTVYAARASVIESLIPIVGIHNIVPMGVGQPSHVTAFMQLFTLGPAIQSRLADVALSFNGRIGRLQLPQATLHQNLKLIPPAPFRKALRLQLREAARHLFTQRALRKANANIFISRFLRDIANPHLRSQGASYVVYNGISSDLPSNNPLSSHNEARSPSKTARILALQSAAKHKDNPTLLRAFKIILDTCKEANPTLTIAGQGPWEPHKRVAESLGISTATSFAGELPQREALSLLSKADLLMSTSRLEAFGMPIIEAMAVGCPAVAAQTSAIPEISGGAAVLVPPGDPKGFAQAAQSILTDASLRKALITSGLLRARYFTWQRSAEAMLRILADIVNASDI